MTSIIVAAPVTAAVVERDWLEPGDGLLTYDTVNGREWLDFPVSRLSQYGGLEHEGNTFLDAVPQALEELAPEGRFEGFTLAKNEHFIDFVESAGSGFETGSDLAATVALIELIGTTAWGVWPIGVLDEINTDYDGIGAGQPYFAAILTPRDPGAIISESWDGYELGGTGLALYRPAVPEPAGALLLLSGVVSHMAVGRCKRVG